MEKPIDLAIIEPEPSAVHGCQNLLTEDKSYWSPLGCGPRKVVFECLQKTLVSRLVIHSKRATKCTVSVAKKNRKRSYIEVASVCLPQDKKTQIKLKFLPAKFIKVELEGNPISAYSVSCFGIDLSSVSTFKGVLYDGSVEEVLFDGVEKSLPDSWEKILRERSDWCACARESTQ